jgi:hypothetical protein
MNAQPETNPNDERPSHWPSGNGHDTAAQAHGVADKPGFGVLLRTLAHEVPLLLSKEVALAKREMQENLESTKAGAIAMATGGAVLLGGFIMLLLSAVYALSLVVDPWLAALIVGGSVVVAGLVMVMAGKKQFEADSLRPDRTMDSLKKDRDAVRRSTQ